MPAAHSLLGGEFHAFRQAAVGPDVAVPALGPCRGFGVVPSRNVGYLETLVVAAGVLREEGEMGVEVGSKELTEMLVGYGMGG